MRTPQGDWRLLARSRTGSRWLSTLTFHSCLCARACMRVRVCAWREGRVLAKKRLVLLGCVTSCDVQMHDFNVRLQRLRFSRERGGFVERLDTCVGR